MKTKAKYRWMAFCPYANTWVTLSIKRNDKFCTNCKFRNAEQEVVWRKVLVNKMTADDIDCWKGQKGL